MSWETTGTVTVTNNSATVTGSGTLFTVKSRVGDAFIGPDGALYEIVNIVSNTVLSISPTYKGVTGSAKAYKIAPVRGYQKLSADRLYTIVNTIGDAVEVVTDLPAWLKAKQPTPVSAGGTGAETQLAARQNLGLKGAAVLDIGTAAGTVAAGDDARLTDAREWIADTIPQAEAEAGTATTRRAFTAQRVRQAIVAWFNGISGALGRTILTRTTAAQVRSDIGLGTTATADLTTSNTDGTAGRVLKVGDGGWMGRGAQQAEALGYPASLGDATNQTKVIRSITTDNGVFPYATGIHFSSTDTWGRLRVSNGSTYAWIQGGNAANGAGWTSQVVLSANLLQTIGTSTVFPMSQKAVTDELDSINLLIGDTSAALDAINGEVI